MSGADRRVSIQTTSATSPTRGRDIAGSEHNARYIVEPVDLPVNSSSFFAPAGVLTHQLQWEPVRATFRTFRGQRAGDGRPIAEHVFTSGVPGAGNETIRFSLYVNQSNPYVAPWQPEPVDAGGDAPLAMERGQALARGVWILLEKLTPTERAASVLREAFDYAYRDIAVGLRLAEANARQVVTRARQHIASDRKTTTSSTEHKRLLEAFVAAAQGGDVAGLEDLFARDVSTLVELVRAA